MCVIAIVDTDSLSALVTRRDRSGDSLFREWIKERHGILAFANSGKFFNEMRRNRAVMELVQRYEQGGQLRKISVEELTIADDQLAEKPYRSNDLHILSLALASEARVLCSNDGNLRADFKDKDILPSVGRRRRVLYPLDGSRKQRRDFLNRRRCAERRPK